METETVGNIFRLGFHITFLISISLVLPIFPFPPVVTSALQLPSAVLCFQPQRARQELTPAHRCKHCLVKRG